MSTKQVRRAGPFGIGSFFRLYNLQVTWRLRSRCYSSPSCWRPVSASPSLRWRRRAPSSPSAAAATCGSSTSLAAAGKLEAILFDCDGVLADTERDGHRLAFNRAFANSLIDEEWSIERYGKLLETGGGKERMIAHWDEVGFPPVIPILGRYEKIANLQW